MPIILANSSQSDSQLRQMIRDTQEGLDELAERMADSGFPMVEPMGIYTARELLGSVSELVASLSTKGSDRAELVRVAIVQYDAMLAAIDLMKVHSSLPRVPRGASSAGAGRSPEPPVDSK
ncbi:MAG: hypothetical protein L3K09_06670 [Thermoplasmata archaeon]|nr:hypothetical protein [Thermoplasmata archaeon]